MRYAEVDVLREVVGNVRVPRGKDVEEYRRGIKAAERGPEIKEESEGERVKRLEREREEIREAERYLYWGGMSGDDAEKVGLERWWTVMAW